MSSLLFQLRILNIFIPERCHVSKELKLWSWGARALKQHLRSFVYSLFLGRVLGRGFESNILAICVVGQTQWERLQQELRDLYSDMQTCIVERGMVREIDGG